MRTFFSIDILFIILLFLFRFHYLHFSINLITFIINVPFIKLERHFSQDRYLLIYNFLLDPQQDDLLAHLPALPLRQTPPPDVRVPLQGDGKYIALSINRMNENQKRYIFKNILLVYFQTYYTT